MLQVVNYEQASLEEREIAGDATQLGTFTLPVLNVLVQVDLIQEAERKEREEREERESALQLLPDFDALTS